MRGTPRRSDTRIRSTGLPFIILKDSSSVGPDPPSKEAHHKILKGSDHVWLAIDPVDRVVGRITAITDGVSCAYIPHLEVVPDYQNEGLGSELVHRMIGTLKDLYMIDLVCDDNVSDFYAKLGFKAIQGMAVRHYDRQNCQSLADPQR